MRPTCLSASAVLLLLLSILTACSPPPPVTPSSLAITGVSVIPLDSDRVLAAQTVIIQGDRITALGPAAATAVPPGARVIDGRARYLLPGLADMHVHIAREEDLLLYLAR